VINALQIRLEKAAFL